MKQNEKNRRDAPSYIGKATRKTRKHDSLRNRQHGPHTTRVRIKSAPFFLNFLCGFVVVVCFCFCMFALSFYCLPPVCSSLYVTELEKGWSCTAPNRCWTVSSPLSLEIHAGSSSCAGCTNPESSIRGLFSLWWNISAIDVADACQFEVDSFEDGWFNRNCWKLESNDFLCSPPLIL